MEHGFFLSSQIGKKERGKGEGLWGDSDIYIIKLLIFPYIISYMSYI